MTNATGADHYADVRLSIADASKFDLPSVVMNFLAASVATCGLLANSPAVVIGAMIIAVLLGPILGVALALVDGDQPLLMRSIVALLGGTVIVVATSYVLGYLFRGLPITAEITARTAPNLLDLLIASAGGAAGAYATISPRLSAAFIGVAIATALVPPLASCGILLAHGEHQLARGAFMLAFTNIVGIQVASSLVMWMSELRRRSDPYLILPNFVSVGVAIALIIVMANNFKTLIQKSLFEASVMDGLGKDVAKQPGNYLANVRLNEDDSGKTIIVRAVVRGPHPLTAAQVGEMEDHLPKPGDGSAIQLRLRYIETTVTTRNGLLYSDQESSLSISDEGK